MFNFYEYYSLQEAKSSCAGQWYLPAGRMEPGEEVAEAAIREVKEETGLDFEPTNLLQIETEDHHSGDLQPDLQLFLKIQKVHC